MAGVLRPILGMTLLATALAGCERDVVLEGERFEPEQYLALAQLCTQLVQRYPVAHVAGHEHIAPGRKQDPGPGFDWPRLQAGLGWPDTCFPQETLLRNAPER